MKIKYSALGLLFLFTPACSIGPNYQRPSISIPAAFKEAPEGWKIAQPQDEQNKGKWWEIFQDPLLNDLEEKLIISNQNIALAMAQYQEAQALLNQAQANYFPTLSISSSGTRQKSSTSTNTNSISSNNASHSPATTYNLIADATWAPDIFGSIRRSVEAAREGTKATKAQLASVQLLAQGSLAQSYFQLRGLDNNQKIYNDTLINYQKLLKITQNQYQAGTISRANILQVKSLLESAEVQALDNHILRAQLEHAIAVLMGRSPSDLKFFAQHQAMSPPQIPLTVPSLLLERRPDIARDERRVAEANAQVGVAIAAYFPTLILSGDLGYSSIKLSTLFNKPAQFWSLGLQLSQALLDGGARSAKIDANYAVLAQTVAQYRQTVLTAFQNVEDNLVALNILNAEHAKQNQAVSTSQEGLDLALNQYKAGTLSFSDILTAEITLFNAQKNASDISTRRMIAAVGLIQALGGGWKND